MLARTSLALIINPHCFLLHVSGGASGSTTSTGGGLVREKRKRLEDAHDVTTTAARDALGERNESCSPCGKRQRDDGVRPYVPAERAFPEENLPGSWYCKYPPVREPLACDPLLAQTPAIRSMPVRIAKNKVSIALRFLKTVPSASVANTWVSPVLMLTYQTWTRVVCCSGATAPTVPSVKW